MIRYTAGIEGGQYLSSLGALTHNKVNAISTGNYASVPHTVITKVTEVKEISRNSLEGIQSQLQRSILIGSCSSAIKTPFRLATLHVIDASADLFDVPCIFNSHGKFSSGNVGHTNKSSFLWPV